MKATKIKNLNYKSFKKAIIEIKPSKITRGGIGVHALRNLKKATIVAYAKYLGEDFFLSKANYHKLDAITKSRIKNFCAISPEGFSVPRDINYISIPWHMNHCCDGNVGFDSDGNFVTIKNVKKGEELCYDYGLIISDPKFKLLCKCGSYNCRKNITGSDWKNEEFRKKNYKYMTPELKNIIKLNIKLNRNKYGL